MMFDLDVLNASHLFRLLARKLFTQETLGRLEPQRG